MNVLKERAHMLEKARAFFKERDILEVDCPLMGASAPIDLHIDVLKVHSKHYPEHYLHTSPEYFMKRLLTYYRTDIYQLAHVFRDEECSPLHNPEFMMAEWYRIGFTLEEMIEETLDFASLFLEGKKVTHLTYREAFLERAGIDYVHATNEELLQCLKEHQITPYKGLENEDRDAHLNLILGTIVEPSFKDEEFVVLKHYPAGQAALAKTLMRGDEKVGLRFELYYKSIELANGYQELLDATEQEARLKNSNKERLLHGKEELPIDSLFLEALKKGLPECSGVAVGFDRLLMLCCKASSLSEIMPFHYLMS